METIFENTHIRTNILTGQKVLVSPHRTKRPWQGKTEDAANKNKIIYDPNCYLCPGNERASGEKTAHYKDTFVFTNDFSALLPNTKPQAYKKGLLEATSERGICKVVCFSPNHSLTMSKMTVDAIEKVISTWQTEFKELGKKTFINYIQIFENRGDVMGCSNPHPHGQIWAQETIPNEIVSKTAVFKKYDEQNQSSILADYLVQELALKERIIYTNDDFVVLVPFWAVWPFETMIIPRQKQATILEMTPSQKLNYAKAIKIITATYDKVFDTSFPYSSGIHQAPTDANSDAFWHWHMSFYPPLLRSATIKKFMVGYEMFAMPQRDITAESAAKLLRELV